MPQDQSPDELQDLLPWYVNGTLQPHELERFQDLLQAHPAAQQDLRFLQRTASSMRLEQGLYEPEQTLARSKPDSH